jgi:plastocyanin
MIKLLLTSIVALLAIAASSCSREESAAPAASPVKSSAESPAEAPPGSPTESPAAKSPKEPRGPIDPAKVGSIAGVVRFEGDAPERKTISSGGTGGCPDHAGPLLSEDALVENRGLANVFVSIQSGLQGWDVPAAKDESFEMDQKGCAYVPHALALRVGQKLLVRNSDPTTHNIKIRSRANEEMNPIQAPGGQPIEWKPGKKEIGASFECNLHPWMKAWVCVYDHPWFAVSGRDGTFVLPGVPPGDYVLEAWHEKFGKKTAKVTVAPGGSADASFTFKAADKPR